MSIYKTNCLGRGDNKLKASATQLVSATNQLKMIAAKPGRGVGKKVRHDEVYF